MKKLKVDLTDCRILLVDDTPANLDVLITMLESEGFDIGIARDGATALQVAVTTPPDLILLDVMMPGIDGYETCRRLKAQEAFEDIPVIFLTARSDTEGTLEGFESGGVDYVTKPFKKEELLARIRTNLERAILARDLLDINDELEQRVRERTQELHLKVAELEGKDRIAQHMLGVHSLEETLAVVLEVVSRTTGVDQAILYTRREADWAAVASTGLVGEDLSDRPTGSSRHATGWKEVLAGLEELEPIDASSDYPCCLVPIPLDRQLIGIIEVANPRSRHALSAANLNTLSSFALLAAVAIRDAQVRFDPEEWEHQLDRMLRSDDDAQPFGA